MMRVPPNSLDLERAVLCAGLLDRAAIDRCDMLQAEHFYSEAHAETWRSLMRLTARGATPDLMTVRDDLSAHGKLAAVGGDEYLFALVGHMVATSTIDVTAREIVALAQRRAVISACHEIAAAGYDRSIDTAAFLDDAEGRMFAATKVSTSESCLQRMDPRPIIQRLQDVATGKAAPMGLPTGVGALDRRIRGLRAGKLVVIAGRPGMGKSALAGVIARSVARTGKLACFFSQEMGAEEHDQRYMSLASGVSATSIEQATVRSDKMAHVVRAAQEMEDTPLWRDDTPRITLPKIRSRVRRAVIESGCELGTIIVDHLGLMRWAGRRPHQQSRQEEIGEYTAALKELAKEWGVPIVLLVQLNRACEQRGGDMRPQMSDLSESGKIEQDADQIVLLYRRGYYAEQIKSGRMKLQRYGRQAPSPDEIQGGDDDGKIEMIVAKCRDGAPGTAYARWDGECTRIVDVDHDDFRPEATVRGTPHYTEGRPDDSDGDGSPWED